MPTSGNISSELRSESSLIPVALQLRGFLNHAYRYLLSAILWPGLVAMLVVLWMSGRRAVSDPIVIMAAAAGILLFVRILLVALIDASSFPAASWEYAGPAFPLSNIAPLLSIAGMLKLLAPKLAQRSHQIVATSMAD